MGYKENLLGLKSKLQEMLDKYLRERDNDNIEIDYSEYQINIEFDDLTKFHLEWNADTYNDLMVVIDTQLKDFESVE